MDQETVKMMKKAVDNEDIALIKELLCEDKELINYNDRVYGSWLQYAVIFGHKKVVELLIDLNMDINAVRGKNDVPIITDAASHGYLEIVRLLHDKGAKTDISTKYKNPLIDAIYRGHFDVVKFLVEHGVDITATYHILNKKSCDVFLYANINNQHEIAEYLKEKFAELGIEKVYIPPNEEKKKDTAQISEHSFIEDRIVEKLEIFMNKFIKKKEDLYAISIQITSDLELVGINANSKSYLNKIYKSSKDIIYDYNDYKYLWGYWEFGESFSPEISESICNEKLKIDNARENNEIDNNKHAEMLNEYADILTNTFKKAILRFKETEIFKEKPDIFVEFYIEDHHSDDDRCNIFKEINGDKYLSEYKKFLKG